MAVAIFCVSLLLAICNWLIFVDHLYQISRRLWPPSVPRRDSNDIRREGLDPAKVAAEIAELAKAFGKVGPGPTCAALFVLCLVIALIAAGLGRL